MPWTSNLCENKFLINLSVMLATIIIMVILQVYYSIVKILWFNKKMAIIKNRLHLINQAK